MRALALVGFAAVLGLVVSQSSDIPAPTLDGCKSHLDHYDCANGAFCEPNSAGDGWVCVLADGSEVDGNGVALAEEDHEDHHEGKEPAASGGPGTCVIHGGHTHGDCSYVPLPCSIGNVLKSRFSTLQRAM